MSEAIEEVRQGQLAQLTAFVAAWCRAHPGMLCFAIRDALHRLSGVGEPARKKKMADLNFVNADHHGELQLGDLSARQVTAILAMVGKHDAALANEIKLLLLRNKTTPMKNKSAPSQASAALSPRKGKTLDFLDIPEHMLARELTLMEWQLFEEVHLRSLLTVKNQQGDSLFEPIIKQYQLVLG